MTTTTKTWSVKPEASVTFEADLNTLHRHCRIACHLAEAAEKNVAAVRRLAKIGSDLEVGDELVSEQVYAVKAAVERLQAAWIDMFAGEEVAA